MVEGPREDRQKTADIEIFIRGEKTGEDSASMMNGPG
jgi:hypothetical protein